MCVRVCPCVCVHVRVRVYVCMCMHACILGITFRSFLSPSSTDAGDWLGLLDSHRSHFCLCSRLSWCSRLSCLSLTSLFEAVASLLRWSGVCTLTQVHASKWIGTLSWLKILSVTCSECPPSGLRISFYTSYQRLLKWICSFIIKRDCK